MDTDPAPVVETPVVEIRGLSKRFGAIQALRGVDFDIRRGEVHGLIGANGAGKSTLIRILAGAQSPDAGEVLIAGDPVVMKNPTDARDLGLSFIHQELNLVPKMTGLQNLTLGYRKPRGRTGLIDWKAAEHEAQQVIDQLHLDFPLDRPVEDLTVAEGWLISLAHALLHRATVVCMDEPTASLSKTESERLFRIIGELSAAGVAILYVSHRLDEIARMCSRVTVFRDGRKVETIDRAEITRARLVQGIVGRATVTPATAGPGTSARGPELLRVENLVAPPRVKDVSFSLHEGEVLGIAGLLGAGRTEVARAIFGVDTLQSGRVVFDGELLSSLSPQQSVRRGIALVPEERRSQGLILGETVAYNSNLSSLRATRRWRGLPFTSRRKARERAARVIADLDVRPANAQALAGQLSGGNQQKIVIGKWLLCDPRVIIFDEPTRGVDVGARAEIYRIIRNLATERGAAIVISSDMEEFALCCDRVLVMAEGRIVGEAVGDEITEERLLRLSYRTGEME